MNKNNKKNMSVYHDFDNILTILLPKLFCPSGPRWGSLQCSLRPLRLREMEDEGESGRREREMKGRGGYRGTGKKSKQRERSERIEKERGVPMV